MYGGEGIFPLRVDDLVGKTEGQPLPPHEVFCSTIKNGNISAEDYQLCQKVWKDNNMTTMKEFLTWYNNKDVEPLLEAIDKMYRYYQHQNL